MLQHRTDMLYGGNENRRISSVNFLDNLAKEHKDDDDRRKVEYILETFCLFIRGSRAKSVLVVTEKDVLEATKRVTDDMIQKILNKICDCDKEERIDENHKKRIDENHKKHIDENYKKRIRIRDRENIYPSKKINLSRAELGGYKLEKANLQGANLWATDLIGANLEKADLQGANLQWVDLRGRAKLRKADLRKADLRSAKLWGANLLSADLRGANLASTDIQDHEANIHSADLSGANLGDADLRGAKLSMLELQSTGLINELKLSYAIILCPKYHEKIVPKFNQKLERSNVKGVDRIIWYYDNPVSTYFKWGGKKYLISYSSYKESLNERTDEESMDIEYIDTLIKVLNALKKKEADQENRDAIESAIEHIKEIKERYDDYFNSLQHEG